MKERIPRYSGRKSTGRNSGIYKDWKENVYKKDGYECQHCQAKEKLVAHHIIPWEEDESLRFEVSNGLTLCISCHRRHHGKIKCNIPKGQTAWNKGLKGISSGMPKGSKFTEEHKEKLRAAKIGFVFTDEHRRKLRESKSPENVEANKLRFKGRTWKMDQITGKRIWCD